MTTDLDRLIEAVDAGTLPESVFHGCSSIRGHWAYTTGLDSVQRKLVFLAYNGSLDSAVSLLEALLPGWGWGRLVSYETMMVAITTGQFQQFSADADNPARALLLATLRAYRSVEGAFPHD